MLAKEKKEKSQGKKNIFLYALNVRGRRHLSSCFVLRSF